MTTTPTALVDADTGEVHDVQSQMLKLCSLLERLLGPNTLPGEETYIEAVDQAVYNYVHGNLPVGKVGDDDLAMLSSPEVSKLLPAFVAAKKEFNPILKEALNPAFRSKYADLKTVLAAVEPALLSRGLVLIHQTNWTADDKHLLYTRLWHVSGQWIASRWKLSPIKSDPQGEGSALSYARRYQVQGLLSLTSEDDDANAASAPNGRRAEAPRRNWLAEAVLIHEATNSTPAQRREALLKLMGECERADQMTPMLNKRFIEFGKDIAAEVTKLAEQPAPTETPVPV